jgi:hypothetical protein
MVHDRRQSETSFGLYTGGQQGLVADIDPTKVEIELNSRFIPGTGDEIVLEAEETPSSRARNGETANSWS